MRHEWMPKLDARRKKFTKTLVSSPFPTSTIPPRMVPVTHSQPGVKEQAVVFSVRAIRTTGRSLMDIIHGACVSI